MNDSYLWMTVQLASWSMANKPSGIHTEHPERNREAQGSRIEATWYEPRTPCWEFLNLWQIESLYRWTSDPSAGLNCFTTATLVNWLNNRLVYRVKILQFNLEMLKWHIRCLHSKKLTSVPLFTNIKRYLLVLTFCITFLIFRVLI